MRAFVQDRYGGAETLQLKDVPVPSPGPAEVLVRVRAASLDRGTWHVMHGMPLIARLGTGVRRLRYPVPGRALAGVVEAVGGQVAGLVVGDEVFGTTPRGALAELTVAPENRLAHKPAGLSFVEAAAVPVSGQTALQALGRAGRLQAGQSVLVIGASGGVGTYAVQLAKALGAEVTAVCSTGKVDMVRALGADHVIDYTRADIDEGGRRYDLVLDIGGNRRVSRLRDVLTPRGTLVIVGGEDGDRWVGGMQRPVGAALLSPFVRQRLVMLTARENSADLETLAELADRGAFRSAVDSTFPLESAEKAVLQLERGAARGKIVVTV